MSIHLPRVWVSRYYPSLDGVRAVAMLSVFVAHYSIFFVHDWFKFGMWGWVGVDLFFVLSGFLITGILYDSLEDPHYFRNFYIRRSLRIFPIFYGFFLLLLLLKPLLHLEWHASMMWFVLYLGNLILPFLNLQSNNPTIILQTIPGHLPREFTNVGVLWSLCVEEQFYLLWPAVIFLVRDRRKLMYLCGGLVVMILMVRSGVRLHLGDRAQNFPVLFYWSTYFRCDTLLMGSFMALWLRGRTLSLRSLKRLSTCLIAIPGSIFSAGLYWVQHIHPDAFLVIQSEFVTTVGFTLLGLACCGVLLRSLDGTSALSHVLRLKMLGKLGAISYGVYFFHALPLDYLRRVAEAHPRLGPYLPTLAFAGVTTFAALSFRYYEMPFQRLKTKFAPVKRVMWGEEPGTDEASQAWNTGAFPRGGRWPMRRSSATQERR